MSLDTAPESNRVSPSIFLIPLLSAAYMLSFMDRQILALLVGPIRTDLQIDDVQVSLLQGLSFALLYGLGSLPAGRLADLLTRTRIIAIGICCWSLMTISCGFARDFAGLFIARAGVGIGESVLSPAAYSLLADAYPSRNLPRALAGFTIGGIVGAGLAFLLGGVIVGYVSQGGTIDVPLLGRVKSWQAVFMIAGAPGIVVGLLTLTLREPVRRDLLRNDGAVTSISTGEVLRFVQIHWRTYVPLALGAAALSVLGYGYLSWFATYLIRVHGIGAGAAGVLLGAIYLVFGPLGAFFGAWVAGYLRRRGYSDANLRFVFIVALMFVPLSTGTLAPNETFALMMAAPMSFFLASYLGVAAAALQLVTPNQMRALVSALFQLTINLLGLVVGPTLVAVLTEDVFQDERAIDKALLLSVALSAITAASLLGLSLRPYRNMLKEASVWISQRGDDA